VDVLGEDEAEREHHAEGGERLDQPRAQLDQVVHQGRFGGLDVLVAHAALPALFCGGSSCTAPAGSAAACASGAGSAACGSGAGSASGGAAASAAAGSVLSGSLLPGSMVKAFSISFCVSAIGLMLDRSPTEPLTVLAMSSACFFRSCSSASRSASWNWPWNSPAMRRTLFMVRPTVRSTAGNSLGPITMSAMTPMTTSSPQPMSNMDQPTPAAAAGFARFKAAAKLSGANALGAPLGLGLCRRAGRMVDALGRLGFRRFFFLGHALFEGLDALREVAHQRRDFSAPAEQDHHHQQHDDPMPDTKGTHRPTLRSDGLW